MLLQAGIFTVEGTVDRDQAKVKATVEVVAPVGVRPISAVVAAGVMPTLPEQVQLVYSDNSEKTFDVTWDAIAESDLTEGAELTVYGALTGEENQKAVAYVRVDSYGEERNVALAVAGSEYPKFTASHTSTYDPLSQVNDGIISFDTSPKNGWGNWKYAPIPEVTTLDLELEEPMELDNISIYFREDDGIYIPQDTLIQYWNAETEEWVDVSNQSQRTGFVSGEEQSITFDPVMTSKLRAQFTRGEQDTSKKKDCLVLTEVEVYACPPEKGNSTAKLESLTLNGEPLEGFDPDQKDYTVTLPYGGEVPEIQATAADHATVFVLPALSNKSAAMIQVTSEDGKTSETYTIQFMETPAAVVSASLRLDKEEVVEDDVIPVHVDALLESGELADEDNLEIRYQVLDAGVPAKAEVRNGSLYAYWPGDVQLQAQIIQDGREPVVSEPLPITILPSQEEKDILGYAQVTVDTKLNQAPVLPQTVKATFNVGLVKDVLVDWDDIEPEKYAKYGTFTVSGTVEGYDLRPTATIRVRDTLGAQNVSLATPVGVEPSLPTSVSVYYTDGTSTLSQVTWEDYDKELVKTEQTFTVNGTTELGGYPVTASVRVTTDTVQSENHAKIRNGCQYSMAISSYSEGGSALALNNGLLDKWTDWSNPNANGDVWFGVIFGADYPETRYVDTIVLDLLEDSTWDRTKITECTVEYYNKPITLDDVPKNTANFDSASMADHPFNDPDNWTEVTNLKQPETYGYGENTLTFDMVEVPAIRVKVHHGTPGDTYYMALREFYAYGKQAVSHNDFTVSNLLVDGEPVKGFDPANHNYQVIVSGDQMPTMDMEADNNASVTFLPATDLEDEAQLLVTSEDGLKTVTYNISFLRDEEVYDHELSEMIRFVESLSEEEYTPESWAVLAEALEAAKAVEANPDATRAQIDEAMANLVKAFGGLEYGVQKQHLQAAVDAACAILEEEKNYDPESIAALKAIVEQAQQMLADPAATQDAVNKMTSDVIDAIVQVAFDDDLLSLESLIQAVESLNADKYTSESWAALQAAVEEAKAVLADSGREDGALANAYTQLAEAIRGLVMRGNKAALAAVIEKANEILEQASDYTESSISGLDEAVKAAEEVYNNEDATQAEVSEAVKALTEVLVQARRKGDVNQDGEVSTKDSTALLRYNAEIDSLDESALEGADVNGDGVANTKDAALILQYASEKIDRF